jgi:hypothetical protein
MSVTGVLVFRDELSQWRSVEWLVKLHTNLLAGSIGRWVNGISVGIEPRFLDYMAIKVKPLPEKRILPNHKSDFTEHG